MTTLANPATRYDLSGEDLPKRLATATVDHVLTNRLFLNSKVGYTFNDRHHLETAYLPELRHNFGRSNIGLAGGLRICSFRQGTTPRR